MDLITKSGCMSITDVNHAVRHLCHVVDVCSKLLKDFHDYCLFNMSDQIVVGIVFSCFWLKNYKNIVLRYSMTSKQTSKSSSNNKNSLNPQQRSLHDYKIPHSTCGNWEINCVVRLSLHLCTQIMEFEAKQAYKLFGTGVLVWKSKNTKPNQTFF